MVSGETVRGDKSKISTDKDSFSSAFEGLSESWQGPSFDSLTSQTQAFVNEFFPTIDSQMEAFAKACDKYKDFSENKVNLKNASDKLQEYTNYQNNRTKNADGEYTTDYSSQIDEYRKKVDEYTKLKETLTTEINSALSEANGQKLNATSISETDFSGGAISTYAPKSIPKLSSGGSATV